MASKPEQLKNYLKQEIQAALGIRIESPDFDKIMGAFANAIDKYLKDDVEVAIGIESEGKVKLPSGFGGGGGGGGGAPTVAQSSIDVKVKSTTTGKLE
jgi:hypothetical protein